MARFRYTEGNTAVYDSEADRTIPMTPGNRHYEGIVAPWLQAGNTPDPYVEPTPTEPEPPTEIRRPKLVDTPTSPDGLGLGDVWLDTTTGTLKAIA